MNNQNGMISHTNKGTIRKIRPNGLAEKELRSFLNKNPNATIEDVEKSLKISRAYAGKLMRKIKKSNSFASKGSAVDKVINVLSENKKPEKKINPTINNEIKLLALIQLIGIEHIEKIIKNERERITKIIGAIK